MQTIKTALVVVVLLGVLYGAYSFLTTPEATPPPEVAEHLEAFDEEGFSLDIDMGSELGNAGPVAIPDTAADDQHTSHPDAYGGNPALPDNADGATPAAPDYGRFSSTPNESAPVNPDVFPTKPSPGVADSETQDSTSELAGALQTQRQQDEARMDEAFRKNGAAVVYNPAVSEEAKATTTNPVTEKTEPKSESAAVQSDVTVFDRAQRTAASQEDQGDLREALATLSVFYNSPDLSAAEHQSLLQRLDYLAGKVIYSREHLLDKPYEVRKYDTLKSIAEQYQVPAQLLQNINGIDNPDVMLAGTKLKVVPGRFRAEIDLKRQELTLFVQNLYAGRFAITVGKDPAPVPGENIVMNKEIDKQYTSTQGTIRGGDPRNPFGHHWLDLGSQISIHGSPDNPTTNAEQLGCISLSPIDARDVYGILSKGSVVKILR